MEDLLKPTLSSDDAPRSIYSSKAMFFVAFFGGPMAIVAFSSLNSRLLGRLKKDFGFYLIAIVLIFGFYVFLFMNVPNDMDLMELVKKYRRENPLVRYGPRGAALIIWAISQFFHRRYHKAMDIVGIPWLNPWKAAIGCVILGGIVDTVSRLVAIQVRGLL